MVFVNFEHHQIMDVISYVKQIEKSVNITNPFEFSDDYRLEVNPEEPPAIRLRSCGLWQGPAWLFSVVKQ